MNVDFSENAWGGAEKNPGLLGRCTPRRRRVSRLKEKFPALCHRIPRPQLALPTGNLSPRDLEFYSSFRAILGKFRGSWKTPLTAWLAKGNPLGPKK